MGQWTRPLLSIPTATSVSPQTNSPPITARANLSIPTLPAIELNSILSTPSIVTPTSAYYSAADSDGSSTLQHIHPPPSHLPVHTHNRIHTSISLNPSHLPLSSRTTAVSTSELARSYRVTSPHPAGPRPTTRRVHATTTITIRQIIGAGAGAA
jgi:hypothetical protein